MTCSLVRLTVTWIYGCNITIQPNRGDQPLCICSKKQAPTCGGVRVSFVCNQFPFLFCYFDALILSRLCEIMWKRLHISLNIQIFVFYWTAELRAMGHVRNTFQERNLSVRLTLLPFLTHDLKFFRSPIPVTSYSPPAHANRMT